MVLQDHHHHDKEQFVFQSICHKQVTVSETADGCSDLILHLNLYNHTLTSLSLIPFYELPITDILYKQDIGKKGKEEAHFDLCFPCF